MKLKNSKLINENFGMKNYIKNLKVEESRTMFKHRCKMTRYVKMNYKNEPRYSKSLWKCENCENIDSESHILWCESYKDIRSGKNLENDKDLCDYIQKVMKIRKKHDEITQKTPKNSEKFDNTPAMDK